MTLLPLQPLPDDWEPTRATLHNYANAVGAIARAHAAPHPLWWHVSLKVTPTGLVTDSIPRPGGGSIWLRMDLVDHLVAVEASDGRRDILPMDAGTTGTEFGRALVALVGGYGLEGEYPTEKYESDEPRVYLPGHASSFFAALVNINHNLSVHRNTLEGQVGPLQVWPHGFDLAFEWFGSEKEQTDGAKSQLNLGFYPAGRAYFYSNPWPFDPALVNHELPGAAAWHTEGFEGSILYFDDLLASDDPAALLMEYAAAVYEVAAPTLA